MKKRQPWIAFFSQTGSELQNIITELGVKPDMICTNNPEYWDLPVIQRNPEVHKVFKSKWTEESYYDAINKISVKKEPVITLHGWLKIIPKGVCDEYEIYNGHPALVDRHPELKGRDMQEAVINETTKYPVIGSVIHQVIPEVDAGAIEKVITVPNFRVYDRDVIYRVLRDTSLRSWLEFLPTVL
jgi:folate-dependent phosphoribosylglycinamide formyltransferase PurN